LPEKQIFGAQRCPVIGGRLVENGKCFAID
jgi:hypothetical protein